MKPPPTGAFVRQFGNKDKTTLDRALSLQSIVVAAKEQVSCPLGDESAILNMKNNVNNVYYSMDAVGTRIWNLLHEPRSVREVCDKMLGEYDVERDRCERDLLDLLEKMKGEGLIEVADARQI